MDGANRLLGRGILRFDMRDPGRFVLRLPHEGQVAPAKLDDARAAVDSVAAASTNEG
jgi:cell division protein FtsQ